MTKELLNSDLQTAIHDVQNGINDDMDSFYRGALMGLMACKVSIARRVLESPFYARDDKNGFVAGILVQNGGINVKKSTLYDSMNMFETEKLRGSPEKREKFISGFSENYASWTDYKNKKLGYKELSTALECEHKETEKVVRCAKCKKIIQ